MIQRENFEATARYFEQRARKAANEARRLQLLAAARFYRAKAAGLAPNTGAAPEERDSVQPVFRRRQRLIELFRGLATQGSSATQD